MANNGVETFLRAEEEAHQLVNELSKLKRETESYSTARTALQDAASGMTTLTDALARGAARLEEVVTTLRSIGTPELLRGQEATTAGLAGVRSVVDAMQATIHALQNDIAARDAKQRAAIQELQARLTKLRRALLWGAAVLAALLGVLPIALQLTRGG